MYDPRKIRRGVNSPADTGIPIRALGLYPEDVYAAKETSESVQDVVREWLDKVEAGDVIAAPGNPDCGRGLVLCGKPRTGKTLLASALVAHLSTRSPAWVFRTWRSRKPNDPADREDSDRMIVRARYWAYNDVVDLARSANGNLADAEEFDLLTARHGDISERPRVLVLDDLGKEYSTEYSDAVTHRILRARHHVGFPTVVTSNLLPDEFAKTYGDATSSFLLDEFMVAVFA
jgi:DNA replication protein DnaC